MIFGIRYSFRILRMTLIGFFICGIVLSGFIAFSQLFNYRYKSQSNEVIQLDSLKEKTLILSSVHTSYSSSEMEDVFDADKWMVQFSDNKSIIILRPAVSIYKTDKPRPEVTINKICRHKTKKEGLQFLKKLPPLATVNDTTISILPYFNIPTGESFRFQEEKVSIYLPVGTKIFIPDSVDYYIDMVDFEKSVTEDDIYGKTWIMTDKGLALFVE